MVMLFVHNNAKSGYFGLRGAGPVFIAAGLL